MNWTAFERKYVWFTPGECPSILRGATDKTIGNLLQVSCYRGQDLKLGPPKYKPGMITTQLQGWF